MLFSVKGSVVSLFAPAIIPDSESDTEGSTRTMRLLKLHYHQQQVSNWSLFCTIFETNKQTKKDGETGNLSPIHLAAMYGYIETANRMISNNLTPPNPSNVHGITPISLAAQNGHLQMVQLLMTSTTNPNVADNYGWTPIHDAA